jgi:hypothetical protein
MSISKTDQIDKDCRYVTKRRPWLIPITWAAPGALEEYTEPAAQQRNARLKAYRQRRRRAAARAQAVVEATTRQTTGCCPMEYSYDTPKVANDELPCGWRSRELRGNRAAPGHTEA